jgi:hypothetical protein
LGIIDFNGRDKDYVGRTQKSISWLKDLKIKNWDLSKFPLEHENLYPNMCNRMDFPYHKIKEMFATSINDITLLWQCGIRQRHRAHQARIYSWKDPRCTVDALGFKTGTKRKILQKILQINQGNDDIKIIPKYITNNFGNWKIKEKVELYVDFEMTCTVFDNFETLPKSSTESLIYMIGVGYIDNNKWIYRSFVTDKLDYIHEYIICQDFINYIQDLSKKYKCDHPKIIHWSHAEPSAWKRMLKRNKNRIHYQMNWYDLLKLFHLEPIAIKGCLSYGLKDIAKTFYHHGFIKTIWDTNGSCSSGVDASLGAYISWNDAKEKNILLPQIPLITEIINYNEIDCQVLQEIIDYLRHHHIDKRKDIITVNSKDDIIIDDNDKDDIIDDIIDDNDKDDIDSKDDINDDNDKDDINDINDKDDIDSKDDKDDIDSKDDKDDIDSKDDKDDIDSKDDKDDIDSKDDIVDDDDSYKDNDKDDDSYNDKDDDSYNDDSYNDKDDSYNNKEDDLDESEDEMNEKSGEE